MSDYKLDLSNYTENQPTPWTDEQYRNAFQLLVIEYHKMKTERDTCLEDIEKLREENRNLKEIYEAQTNYNCKLDEENKELQIQNDLLYQFSKHIGSNPSSSTYKKFRKQLDDIGIRECE